MPACKGIALAALLAALALLTLTPRSAAAAMLQCYEDVSSQPSELALMTALDGGSATSWSCDGSVIVAGDHEVPICLEQGASAVAPRIIHGIGDARIEAVRPCHRFDSLSADEIALPSDEAPDRPPQTPMMATVAPVPQLPAAPRGPREVRVIIQERPALGFRPQVFRPPRG